MAPLKLLPAAAWTWLIPTYLFQTIGYRLLAARSVTISRFCGRRERDAGTIKEAAIRGNLDGSARLKYRVGHLLLNGEHEFIEKLSRLAFVFDERIALAIALEANAGAQMMHGVEMFDP